MPIPDDLRRVATDHDLATSLHQRPDVSVAVTDGDMYRTLGEPALDGRPELNELPVDLLDVTLDDGDSHVAIAHVVVRSSWWRGGWWRGRILAVMNAEYMGAWDVAPRGHPNDGRVETFDVDRAMSVRQRIVARRRLSTGTHVPHPDITTRSVRRATWTFEHPLEIFVDGRHVGRARAVAVEVRPDAAVILA